MNTVKPSEHMIALAQRYIGAIPVIVLGSGASAAHGLPGMPGLRDYIVSNIVAEEGNQEEQNAWQRFVAEVQSSDLETALTKAPLTETLTQKVVDATWDLLMPLDRKIFEETARSRKPLPLTLLFRHFFTSTRREINVVTPNYDRIAEYAADVGGWCHCTGFGHGHLRFWQREPLKSTDKDGKMARTVRIWKVHGSLDWFYDASPISNGVTLGLPVTDKRIAGFSPAIVTPGIDKYRQTHNEPFRTIMSGADSALERAAAYLCIGYGFNDQHIQPKLLERCKTDNVPIVVLAKTLSATAKQFLLGGDCRSFLALEECEEGTRMYCPEHPTGITVSGEPIWQLEKFLASVILPIAS